MSESIAGSGRCLCGAVRVTAKNVKASAGACHCTVCRKWGGGPLMAVDCGADVVFDGEANISVFDSSQWAERGFCKQCGTHLFYRLKHGRQYMLPAGLLDDAGTPALTHQLFIDEKPPWYAFANQTEDMTGAEIFARYAPAPENA